MALFQTIRFAIRTASLERSGRLPPARIFQRQQRRLRKLVRYAVANSPFYRHKYRGLDLSNFQLEELPTTNKQELLANFDHVLTDFSLQRIELERFVYEENNLGRWYQGKYAISHTSGTQGAPLLIVQDRHSIETVFAVMGARANAGRRLGALEGIRRLFSPSRVAVVAVKRGFYPSAAAFEFLPELVGPFVRLKWFSSTDPNLVDLLREFQPHGLVAYASVLNALALQAPALGLKELRQIGNSSECLSPTARRRVERAFGVPIFDHYGVGECLQLSDGCSTDGGAHVNADWAILEIVDDAYRPVPPGQLGSKVLVTNLANRAQPFIRYELGDQLSWATSSCRCGSALPRIERIEGRSAEVFWVRDWSGYRILSGALFHNAVDSLREAQEWQAIQLDRNWIEIRLKLQPNAKQDSHVPLRDALTRILRNLGLPETITIDVQFVPSVFPDARTGKVRRMISHVGVPNDLQASA